MNDIFNKMCWDSDDDKICRKLGDLLDFHSMKWEQYPNRSDQSPIVLSVTNEGFIYPKEHFEFEQSGENISQYKVVERGDFAYNPSRINVGSIARQDLEDVGLISPMYISFSIKEGSPHYFDQLFGSEKMISVFDSLSTGSVRQTLNKGMFEQIYVPFPDIEEQHKIASILYSLDDMIQKSDEIIEKVDKVKYGLQQDIFFSGISEEGNLRDPSKERNSFKETPIGNIPESWECITLGNIINRSGGFIQTGPFGSQLHKEEYVSNGIPVVMPQDIEDSEIKTDDIAEITTQKTEDLARHKMEPNDVLIARRGDLKRASSITQREKGWICGTGCLLIRPPKNEIDGQWLKIAYQHPRSQQQINSRAVGSTMSNLNQSILETLQLALPPVEEQKKIVKILSEIDNYMMVEKKYRSKLQLIKKGLAQDFLSGDIRTHNKNIKILNEVLQHE